MPRVPDYQHEQVHRQEDCRCGQSNKLQCQNVRCVRQCYRKDSWSSLEWQTTCIHVCVCPQKCTEAHKCLGGSLKKHLAARTGKSSPWGCCCWPQRILTANFDIDPLFVQELIFTFLFIIQVCQSLCISCAAKKIAGNKSSWMWEDVSFLLSLYIKTIENSKTAIHAEAFNGSSLPPFRGFFCFSLFLAVFGTISAFRMMISLSCAPSFTVHLACSKHSDKNKTQRTRTTNQHITDCSTSLTLEGCLQPRAHRLSTLRSSISPSLK